MNSRRRTLQVFEQLDEAGVQGCLVALTGPGVSDVFVQADHTRQRIHKALAAYAHERGLRTIVFSQGWGAQHVTAPGASGSSTRPPGRQLMNADETFVALIDEIRQAKEPTLLALDWTDILLQDTGSVTDPQAVILERIAHLAGDGMFRSHGHRFTMLVRHGQLNRRLSQYPGIVTVTVPIPDEAERRLVISSMIADQERPLRLDPSLKLDRATLVSRGLQNDDWLRLRDRSATTPVTERELVKRKNAAISRDAGDTIIVHEGLIRSEADVAGHWQIKAALDDHELTGQPTLRVLLLGPPGVGKSYDHQYIAFKRGEPAISFGHVRERWVGASEERMAQAIATKNALDPTCLFIDEAETELGRRSNTADEAGRTDTALRAELFKMLGDTGDQTRGSVIAASNRPDMLDSAALDRFVVVPVLHPVGNEVVDYMRIHADRAGHQFDADSVAKVLSNTQTMSGRQAVRLVDRAAVHAARRRSPVIEGNDIQTALEESMYQLSVDEILHSLLAVKHCTFTAYLPWVAAAHSGHNTGWPSYLNGIVNNDGTIRLDLLDRRIAELVQAGAR